MIPATTTRPVEVQFLNDDESVRFRCPVYAWDDDGEPLIVGEHALARPTGKWRLVETDHVVVVPLPAGWGYEQDGETIPCVAASIDPDGGFGKLIMVFDDGSLEAVDFQGAISPPS